MRLRQILSLCLLSVISCTFLFYLITGKSSIILGTLTTDYLSDGTTTTVPYTTTDSSTDSTVTAVPTTTTDYTTTTVPTTTSTTDYTTTTAPTATTSDTATTTTAIPTTTTTTDYTTTEIPTTTTTDESTTSTLPTTTTTSTNPVNIISVPIAETSPDISTTDTEVAVQPSSTDTTVTTTDTTATGAPTATTAAPTTTTTDTTATPSIKPQVIPAKVTPEMLDLSAQIKNPVTTNTRYCLGFPFKLDALAFNMEGKVVKALQVSQVSESPVRYCATLKIEDFPNGNYKITVNASYKGSDARNFADITINRNQSQEIAAERNSELENKCSQTGADSSEECKDYYMEKYAATIDCRNLDSTECRSAIKATYLAAIVKARKEYASLDEQSASILAKSMTAGKLENMVNNTISGEKLNLALPLKEKETEIKIIRSYGKIIVDKDKGLIRTAPIIVTIDTDSDGIPDDIEKRIGTKPNVSDTDGDGYKDGEEVLNGYDPLGEGKKAVSLSPIEKALIANEPIEHPKTEGEETDSLSVSEVKATYGDKGKQSGYMMNGKAFPNSILTLYIYSDIPIVTTVTTDEFGNWEYHFEKPLEDGNHEVYISINDETGKVVKKSSPVGFLVQEAQAATEVAIPTNQESDKMINYYLYAAGVLIVVGALVFVTALVKTHRKNKEANSKDNNTNVKA